ncbi:DUF1534 domain-containing protein [Pseudomonas syringae]|nr:DUF1534 domain-containing protein [Pseudomonas syringae]
MGVQLLGGSPQRGNALRDAPRHRSVPLRKVMAGRIQTARQAVKTRFRFFID